MPNVTTINQIQHSWQSFPIWISLHRQSQYHQVLQTRKICKRHTYNVDNINAKKMKMHLYQMVCSADVLFSALTDGLPYQVIGQS